MTECSICLHLFDDHELDDELAQPTCKDCSNAYKEYLD